MLGGLRVVSPDRTVDRFRTQKTASLLAYLAYHPERPRLREELTELLWPQEPPHSGRNSLSTALWWLRQELELPGAAPVVLATRATVSLNSGLVCTDVARFEDLLRRAGEEADRDRQTRLLAEAVDLYRGPLLPSLYDEWVLLEQNRLAGHYHLALRQLAGHLEHAGELQAALSYAMRAVRADPLCEEAHYELMRLFQAIDQPSAALRQYRELVRVLQEELDTTPGEASRSLAQTLSRLPRVAGVEGLLPEPQGSSLPVAIPGANGRGGAVPLASPLYLERPVDAALQEALLRQESIILIKGAAQTGKTSLLARGVQAAREHGARVILTDLQKLGEEHLASAERLFRVLAEWLGDQLELEANPDATWGEHRSPAVNFERYVRREILGNSGTPVVWALDEVDRLFAHPCGTEVFRLFRAWHNERALDPGGPWSRLTLAIAYASEAHLFIRDLNQSPFNVGLRLDVGDFMRPEVEALHQRFGRPLADAAAVGRLLLLTGGHPYLTVGCLGALRDGAPLSRVEEQALREDGLFSEHLAGLLRTLRQEPELVELARVLLRGRRLPDQDGFYRLRSAGVVAGQAGPEARFRCGLYERYLRRHLT
jgi:DNA-binding SARP family transcriptional activator